MNTETEVIAILADVLDGLQKAHDATKRGFVADAIETASEHVERAMRDAIGDDGSAGVCMGDC